MADVMRPSSSLYGLFAFVTGDVFNRMVLGFAFGGLSAVWLTRIYRKGGSVDAAPEIREIPLSQAIDLASSRSSRGSS